MQVEQHVVGRQQRTEPVRDVVLVVDGPVGGRELAVQVAVADAPAVRIGQRIRDRHQRQAAGCETHRTGVDLADQPFDRARAAGLVAVHRAEDDEARAGLNGAVGDRLEGLHRRRSFGTMSILTRVDRRSRRDEAGGCDDERGPIGAGRAGRSLSARDGAAQLRVVEDDAGGVALPAAHAAHAVPQVDAVDAARALHRPVMDRDHRGVALVAAAAPSAATACAGAARSSRTRRR